MKTINFNDIGRYITIEEIIEHLCSNKDITIVLNRNNSDRFSGQDMIELVKFISEVEPEVANVARSNYRRTDGECLVGEMIFTYYNSEFETTTVVKF